MPLCANRPKVAGPGPKWECGLEDNYTGTEQVPAVIAFRAQVFDGFAGTIEVALEEQNGVTQTVFLNADNFYEWNLSTGSGTYRIQSVSATEGDLSFVTEFSNMYQNLPEEGLLVMPIMVTKVEIENTLEAEKSQEKEVKEDNEQEMNTSLEQNQGNKTSVLISHWNIVWGKLKRSHFALISIYSWMQQKNCMAFRLVSNLHSKTFRYTYRKIWKIIQEFTDCLLKIWQGCAIILFVMPMHMIHCYCGWQGVKSNE